jgi:hypothetical protein
MACSCSDEGKIGCSRSAQGEAARLHARLILSPQSQPGTVQLPYQTPPRFDPRLHLIRGGESTVDRIDQDLLSLRPLRHFQRQASQLRVCTCLIILVMIPGAGHDSPDERIVLSRRMKTQHLSVVSATNLQPCPFGITLHPSDRISLES